MRDLKPGDIVRVRDTSAFLSSFAKKVADRDAIVNWVGPDKHGQFEGRTSVTFQKRKGRGKEFREIMRIKDLVLAGGASKEAAAAAAPSQWISVADRLPECRKKPGSQGVEVIVYPQPEKGESTAFFGCRLTDEPDFYKYGSRVAGVTHWMPLPAPPTQQKSSQGENGGDE